MQRLNSPESSQLWGEQGSAGESDRVRPREMFRQPASVDLSPESNDPRGSGYEAR